MEVDFAADTFDAAVAFYSLFHLPREEHAAFFDRLGRWVKPDGHTLVTVAETAEAAYTEDGFFDVTMYWSHWGPADYHPMLGRAGFVVLAAGTAGHGYRAETGWRGEAHPYLFARTGASSAA